MQYVQVKVKRDGQTTTNSPVAPWEVPILEVIFEKGNIEIVGNVDVQRPYPEPSAEFARLAKVYGADSETGVTYVASAYGDGRNGLNSLRAAIGEAQAEDAAAQKPAPAASRKPRKAASDPLMA